MENMGEKVRNLSKSGSAFEKLAGAGDQVEQQGYQQVQDYCEISSMLVMTHLGYSFTMIRLYLRTLHGTYTLPRPLQGIYGVKTQLQLLE
jgi:hypothetical protein